MATLLGTTFSIDEQVVAQCDITYMGKMVNRLSWSSTRQSMNSFYLLALRALGRDSTARSPRGPAFKSL